MAFHADAVLINCSDTERQTDQATGKQCSALASVLLTPYLVPNFHCSLCNCQIGPPYAIQWHLLILNGCNQLLDFVLKANGVDIQSLVQKPDCF